jgi:uncharacterized protein (TIGR02271 family)
MQTTIQQIQPGWDVIGSDGQKVGEVNEVGQTYVLVTKGLIFLKDLYIPFDAINNVDASRQCAYLDVAKDDVESMGWDDIPAAGESRTTGYAGGPEGYETSDTVRVPVHEEELQAEKRSTRAGEVQIGKRVTEEEKDLEVPRTREEVNVRRVSVDRDATGDEQAFTDGDTVRVPVTEEEVEVTKRPRVVEEIEVSKRPTTETQRVSDTVRREHVDVQEQGDVRVNADRPDAMTAGTAYTSGDRGWQSDATDTRDPRDLRGVRDPLEEAEEDR